MILIQVRMNTQGAKGVTSHFESVIFKRPPALQQTGTVLSSRWRVSRALTLTLELDFVPLRQWAEQLKVNKHSTPRAPGFSAQDPHLYFALWISAATLEYSWWLILPLSICSPVAFPWTSLKTGRGRPTSAPRACACRKEVPSA